MGSEPGSAGSAGCASVLVLVPFSRPARKPASYWRIPMAIRPIALFATLAVFLVAGCSGQKAAQNTPGASADSLLASSPIEPAQGQLQPQATVPQPAPEQTAPTPTPAPAPKATPPPQAKPK